jgi:hypothetical protein
VAAWGHWPGHGNKLGEQEVSSCWPRRSGWCSGCWPLLVWLMCSPSMPAWGGRRSGPLPGWGGNRETLALARAVAAFLDQETLMFDAFMATAQAASSCAVVP